MSVKTAAAKTAKAIVWPVKTPKRLTAWVFVGVAVFAVFLYGAIVMVRGPQLLAQASNKASSAIYGVAHSVRVSLAPDKPDGPNKVVTSSRPVKPDKAEPFEPQQPTTDKAAPSPPFVPIGTAQWAQPRMRATKLDPDDACYQLKGLYHNIMKCWSNELIEGTSISRYIYHMRGAR